MLPPNRIVGTEGNNEIAAAERVESVAAILLGEAVRKPTKLKRHTNLLVAARLGATPPPPEEGRDNLSVAA